MPKKTNKRTTHRKAATATIPGSYTKIEGYGISATLFVNSDGEWSYTVHHHNRWELNQPPIAYKLTKLAANRENAEANAAEPFALTSRDTTLEEAMEALHGKLLTHAVHRLRNLRWRRECDTAEWLSIQAEVKPVLGEKFDEYTTFPHGFPGSPTLPQPKLLE